MDWTMVTSTVTKRELQAMSATSCQAIQCGVDIWVHMYILLKCFTLFHLLQKHTSPSFGLWFELLRVTVYNKAEENVNCQPPIVVVLWRKSQFCTDFGKLDWRVECCSVNSKISREFKYLVKCFWIVRVCAVVSTCHVFDIRICSEKFNLAELRNIVFVFWGEM